MSAADDVLTGSTSGATREEDGETPGVTASASEQGAPERLDAWGVRTRLGIVVPADDIGQESELQHLAAPDVRIHTARVETPERGDLVDPRQIAQVFATPPRLDEAVASLARAAVDAIACAFTSSAYLLGARAETAMIERVSARSRAIPLVTSTVAVRAALAELDVSRISLVHPPWFDAELDELGGAYFDAAGYEVASHRRSTGMAVPRRIDTGDLTRLVHAIVRRDRPDAVLLAGNEFATTRLVNALEEALGVHVITSNQAVYWWLMRSAGHAVQNPSAGSLFAVPTRG